jgi:hypothetical protein
MPEVESVPFPHIVIDGLWNERVLSRARREINERVLTVGFDNPNEKKYGAGFEAGGYNCQTVRGWLKSDEWMSQVEEWFGFEDRSLTYDDVGGGIHFIPTGGFLNVHIDFNRLNGLYRRVNCLIYLNEDWRPGDGGELELWASKDGPCVKKIEPLFNRTCVFMTGENSWHGHPHPLVRGPRVSFAAYFYHEDPPTDFVGEHSTVFVEDKS